MSLAIGPPEQVRSALLRALGDRQGRAHTRIEHRPIQRRVVRSGSEPEHRPIQSASRRIRVRTEHRPFHARAGRAGTDSVTWHRVDGVVECPPDQIERGDVLRVAAVEGLAADRPWQSGGGAGELRSPTRGTARAGLSTPCPWCRSPSSKEALWPRGGQPHVVVGPWFTWPRRSRAPGHSVERQSGRHTKFLQSLVFVDHLDRRHPHRPRGLEVDAEVV